MKHPLLALAAFSLAVASIAGCGGNNSTTTAGGEAGSMDGQDAAAQDAGSDDVWSETATVDVAIDEPLPCSGDPDCRTDQRCVGQVCKNHLVCDSELIWDETGCTSRWFDCDNGKEYRFFCLNVPNHDWECYCLVNDVLVKDETLAINWQAVCPGVNATVIHRVADEFCNWLVPKLNLE